MLRRAAIAAALLAVALPAAPAAAQRGCPPKREAAPDSQQGPRFTGKVTAAARRCRVHRADGRLSDWRGKPTNVSGRTVLSRGEYVYTDWLYDDHGPDLDGLAGQPQYRAALAPVLGDYEYPPEERFGLNAADLREVRVAADRRGLHFLVRLQTMKTASTAIVSFALDAGRGDQPWPDGVRLDAGGAERFVTTWGTGARYTGPGGRSRRLRRVAVNLRANAIEVDVPNRVIGRLRGRPRVWVAAGLNDGGRFQTVRRGETGAWNVGFREETYQRLGSGWSEQQQSRALADRDVTRFAGRFSMRRLKRRRSGRAAPLEPGFHNRIFRSRKDYGEGAVPGGGPSLELGGTAAPKFLSRWQPYGIYIPEGWDPSERTPLTLVGHSLDSNLNQYANVAPNLLRQLGDERGSILLTPLARGGDTWYLEAGLIDVLEAWRDVRRNFAIDRERTAITGYSMGGYMTYRLGLLMPDRFSRASVYVGPPAYQFWAYPGPILPGDPEWTVPGNTNQIVENAHNLPYEIVHGNLDELVPVTGVQHQADTFAAAGNEYRFFRHSADDHLSFILNDEWGRTRDWLGSAPRDRNPVEVVYRRFPSMDLPEHGLVFDKAYWLSGIEVRSAPAQDSSGIVRATTYGFGGNRKAPRAELPAAVPGPVTPGVLTQQRQIAGEPIARSNGFEAALENVSGAGFDVERMGLDARRPLRMLITSDGEADITLFGDFGAVSAGGLPVAGAPGRVVITVPAGSTDVVVRPQ